MSCCPPVRTAHSSCGQYWRLGYGRAELERQEITGEYSQGGDNSIVMPERGDVNAGEMWGCASINRASVVLLFGICTASLTGGAEARLIATNAPSPHFDFCSESRF